MRVESERRLEAPPHELRRGRQHPDQHRDHRGALARGQLGQWREQRGLPADPMADLAPRDVQLQAARLVHEAFAAALRLTADGEGKQLEDALARLASHLREGKYVPFGPFLAGGGIAAIANALVL